MDIYRDRNNMPGHLHSLRMAMADATSDSMTNY